VIDIHTHLLPGVDDGAPTVEAALPVLERFGADGVTLLVCTPHLTASAAREVAPDAYAEVFAALCESAPAVPVLQLGWEIMLDAPGIDFRPPHLHLGRSNAVLVEFSRHGVPPGSTSELRRIRNADVVPVVAHPERYVGCGPGLIAEWRSAGAVIQVDAAALLGSGKMSKQARALLEAGLVDCIASDNHGDSRSLASARRWLMEVGTEEQADLLTRVNAERLLAGLSMLPVPPLPRIDSGMLSRLRDLILGR